MWKLAPAATPLLSRTLAQAREGTARRVSSRLAVIKRVGRLLSAVFKSALDRSRGADIEC